MAKHRNRVSMFLILATALIVAGAVSYEFVLNHSTPQLLRTKIEDKTEDLAMFTEADECNKVARNLVADVALQIVEERHKDPKLKAPKVDVRCVAESDPGVPPEWRNPLRTRGMWRGSPVFYYRKSQPQNVDGAYVLALPSEEGYGHDPEIGEIFVDQRTCDAVLARDKQEWKNDLELQNDAEHDAKLKAQIGNGDYTQTFKDDEREASAACLPIANAKPLIDEYCQGLPLRLDVSPVGATYRCDWAVVKPSPLQ